MSIETNNWDVETYRNKLEKIVHFMDPLDKRVFSSLPLYNKHVFRLVWSVLSIRLGSVHYRIDAITLLLCHLSSEVGSFGLAVLWDRAYRFLLDIG